MSVNFLHIPKTAGQSVHQLLVDSFGQKNVAPYRVNAQLSDPNILGQLKDYKVLSGHIDYEIFEKYSPADFSFTVLRDPLDRILSYYFYLRAQAEKNFEKLHRPEFKGMKAALELSPDDYFCDATGELRVFIDNHYDNFYAFYFATKRYSGRQSLFSSNPGIRAGKIFDMAMHNLFALDAVYTLNNWTNLSKDLSERFPTVDFKDKEYFVNQGDALSTLERLKSLEECGPCKKAVSRINEMCSLDKIIYEVVDKGQQLDYQYFSV